MSEAWKDIEGYDGRYSISNAGRIRSNNYMNSSKTKILSVNKLVGRGYVQKILYANGKKPRGVLLHRLVAEAFLDKPEFEDQINVNHKDGNKLNNSFENLEWVNHQENNAHARRTGLNKNFGSRCHQSKLEEFDVLAIRKLVSMGRISQARLARAYGVTPMVLSNILTGKSWRWLK